MPPDMFSDIGQLDEQLGRHCLVNMTSKCVPAVSWPGGGPGSQCYVDEELLHPELRTCITGEVPTPNAACTHVGDARFTTT